MVKDTDANRAEIKNTDGFSVKLEMLQQTWYGGGRAGGRLVHRAEKIEVEQRRASTRFRTRDGERGEKVHGERQEKIGKQKLTYAQIWISDENYVTGLVLVSVSEKHEEYVNIQHKTWRRLLQLLTKHLV